MGSEPTRVKPIGIANQWALRGLRTVIPSILKNGILEELHEDHIDMTKIKDLARSYVSWPNVDKDIEDLSRAYRQSFEVQKESKKDTDQFWEFPSTPWQKLHIDFAGKFLNRYLLLGIDAHSKWTEIFSMIL